MQLDPEIIGQLPGVTDDQKEMLIRGEIAETLMKSPAWKILLDWAEMRCNLSLGKLKDAAFANHEAQRAFLQLWRVNEDWLRDIQIYFAGLVKDRDAVINDLSASLQDIPVRDMPVVESNLRTEHEEMQ